MFTFTLFSVFLHNYVKCYVYFSKFIKRRKSYHNKRSKFTNFVEIKINVVCSEELITIKAVYRSNVFLIF